MPKNAFERRAQTLENEFFRRVDLQLIVKLQKQHQLECDQDALAIASGVIDRQVLDELLAIEITPKTLVAFSLFPAVYVAWANGSIEQEEREAVLRAAHDQGLSEDCPAHQLLDSWLKRKPSTDLLAAWKGFIYAMRPTISAPAFNELRDAAMKRAYDIAEAAGGFLQLLSISAKEKAALAELDAVFSDAADTEKTSVANKA